MRFQGLALAAALMASLATQTAQAEGFDPKLVPGVVLSLGRAETNHSGSAVGSGFFLDANYTRTFVNGGTDYQQYGDVRVLNGYFGVGFSRLLQLQLGYGNNGVVRRYRSDFNLAAITDFLTGRTRSRYERTLGSRFTFTVAAESYPEQPRLDNFHIGVGLLY